MSNGSHIQKAMKIEAFCVCIAYTLHMGMVSMEQYLDTQLAHGRAFFTREEALAELRLSPLALKAALTRLIKRQKLANPRHGFYLILRPEDRVAGAPDPARWIDPLMRYQQIDYRVSLLRAAAYHGSSHQAAMTFQVIAPKQLRGIEIGRQRIEFIYQSPADFAQANQSEWLASMKTEAGFAKMAGVELTLLDCARYFHKAAGMSGLLQIVKDFGAKANAARLAKAAAIYPNPSVRRLGYLLDQAGHRSQARALEPFAKRALKAVPLDPSVKPLVPSLVAVAERDAKWKLILNEILEADF